MVTKNNNDGHEIYMNYISIKAGDNAIVQITSNKHDEYTFACH
jgi:hypothetical protein